MKSPLLLLLPAVFAVEKWSWAIISESRTSCQLIGSTFKKRSATFSARADKFELGNMIEFSRADNMGTLLLALPVGLADRSCEHIRFAIEESAIESVPFRNLMLTTHNTLTQTLSVERLSPKDCPSFATWDYTIRQKPGSITVYGPPPTMLRVSGNTKLCMTDVPNASIRYIGYEMKEATKALEKRLKLA